MIAGLFLFLKGLLPIAYFLKGLNFFFGTFYKFSKGIQKIDFNIQLLDDLKLPDGHFLKEVGIFDIRNAGYPSVSLKNDKSKNPYQAITLYAELSFSKRILSQIKNKLFKRKESHIKELAIQLNEKQDPQSNEVFLKKGDKIQVSFSYKNCKDFFINGKSFFVEDVFGERHYIRRGNIKHIQEVLTPLAKK
ncbi:MAG: hypothetical protein ACR2M7_01325 [Bdellovibrionales bacterium]